MRAHPTWGNEWIAWPLIPLAALMLVACCYLRERQDPMSSIRAHRDRSRRPEAKAATLARKQQRASKRRDWFAAREAYRAMGGDAR